MPLPPLPPLVTKLRKLADSAFDLAGDLEKYGVHAAASAATLRTISSTLYAVASQLEILE